MQLSVIISVLLPLLVLFNTGDATITAWSVPVIATGTGAGALSFAENLAIGTAGLAKTVVATPGGGETIASYTLLTTGTPFSLVGTTGVLNLDSVLDFETTASYIIEIRAVDTTGTALSATATITITVTDVNDETPTFGAPAYSQCIADGSAVGTTLATILANDADAVDTTFTNTLKSETDGATVFTASITGVITSTAVMAAATTSKYGIILRAEDANSHTATTLIYVEVGCSSATTVAIGITTLLVALVTALQ